MTKEEYYEEERRFEAEVEAGAEYYQREDEPYEDVWTAHGFRNEADYWNWKGY